jgi:3-dehydroquinate dehydratase
MSNPFTKLAVPIVSAQRPLAEQIEEALHAAADVIELRVDRIADIDAVEAVLTVRCKSVAQPPSAVFSPGNSMLPSDNFDFFNGLLR